MRHSLANLIWADRPGGRYPEGRKRLKAVIVQDRETVI
jgi:hypothetical protein